MANVEAFFNKCLFNSPNGAFVETYINITGTSVVTPSNDKGIKQGKLLVSQILKQNNKIVDFKKYELVTVPCVDSVSPDNVIDQQRFKVANGAYELEIEIDDLNDDKPGVKSTHALIVDFSDQVMQTSDIQLIESIAKADKTSEFSKSGYNILPYVSDYYPADIEKIGFYMEIYNASKVLGDSGRYLLNYYIEEADKGKIISDLRDFKRMTAAPVGVVLDLFSITSLPSGNYNLVIEARSVKNDLLLKQKRFFQRSNPNVQQVFSLANYKDTWVNRIHSRDTLKDFIKCTRPIATELELAFEENQMPTANNETLKQYILNFWMKRDRVNPEAAWNKYYEKVKAADKYYSTSIKRGYEADRGRVYLMYGAPKTITRSQNEPSAYPYEIWHFLKVEQTGQTNRRFVFYNQDLVSNDYELLHSDVMGEVTNPQWKTQLHRRQNNYRDPELNEFQRHYGGRIEENFELPR